MASTALTKTFGSASSASDRYKFTFSTWFKRGVAGDNDYLFGHQSSDGANDFAIRLDKDSGNPRLRVYDYQSSSYTIHKQTSRFFRDHSAWYHLVVKIDTTQSSASDRVKIYINGVEETSFSTSVNPSQNQSVYAFSNTSQPTVISGRYTNSLAAGYYFDGSLTHTHCCIGYAYDASSFGETDTTSGIWKPKTAPSVTYGSNGFFLKFENSGAMGTDSSGNSNTFTVNGTLTQMVDSPTNNFNTLNPNLISSGVTISNASRSFNSGSAVNYGLAGPNFALNKGKWYFEYKIGHPCAAGFIADTYQIAERIRGNTAVGNTSEEYAWEGNGYIKTNNGQTAYGSAASAGNIIGMYVDLDNNKLYIGVNGVIQNSGTGFSITDPDNLTSGFYYIGGMSDQCGATANVTADMNFGDGFFGTTAVSSAQADANGEGVFEYSPNDSGGSSFDSAAKNFYALNTKNIKEFG